MKLMEWLKKVLPAPRLPKKRYVVLVLAIAYAITKLYVIYTPDPNDDELPDKIRDSMVTIFASEEGKPDPSSYYDAEGLRYGEGYS